MHHIVNLDAHVVPHPDLFSFPHTLTQHTVTPPNLIAERIADATIILVTAVPIGASVLGPDICPKLQLIAAWGTGTDLIDKEACARNGITVCKVPAQSTETVTEHALALYFAVKRKTISMQGVVRGGGWQRQRVVVATQWEGLPPRTCREEICGVIGYGALGASVERMAKALGMTVLVAERKDARTVREGRTAFERVIEECTTLIVTCPLDASTRDMVSYAELKTMKPTAIIVNVARGGIVNETALADALRQGEIAGAGIDVFESEPAGPGSSPLLAHDVPNLTLSPHVAWYSSATIKGTQEVMKANVEGFVNGRSQNVVVEGRQQ
ncbi:hypothetical protein LTR66_004558 [Elasticomyces elasticus]|nr:hypothetical protein LTR50_004867 [Elasticomyces elasticus]KAK4995678.1 hypothetical protein LTR66_004558 [Elasticomyces elasticus]KAK5003921.1 hypothetical protein LTR28_009585 [Elasticomyces elasticus]